MRNWSAIVILLVAGCSASTPPGAHNVMLHEHTSTILQDCERLGPVSSQASLWKAATIEIGQAQAKNNLRAAAYRQYGADTVVLVNMDTSFARVDAQGVAFNCNK